jgi:hypothetical protein
MDAGVVMSMAAPRRRVFRVQLSATACTEVNFKELVRDYERVHGSGAAAAAKPKPPVAIDTSADPLHPAAEELVGGLPLSTSRTQRFDIIERLEKRYGGGAVVGPPAGGTGGGGGDEDDGDGFVRGDDDDLYDSEDSFIDDEELQQNIEEIHTQARVQTKHSGFFVNAGDQIETIGGAGSADDDDEGEPADVAVPAKKAKRPKKGGAESSRAVKAFLDEWSEAASDWQPGAEIEEGMEALRQAVRDCECFVPALGIERQWMEWTLTVDCIT